VVLAGDTKEKGATRSTSETEDSDDKFRAVLVVVDGRRVNLGVRIKRRR
jgi:hypothetical protein